MFKVLDTSYVKKCGGPWTIADEVRTLSSEQRLYPHLLRISTYPATPAHAHSLWRTDRKAATGRSGRNEVFCSGAIKLSRVGVIGLVLLALHSVTPPSFFYPLLPKYLLLVWRDC